MIETAIIPTIPTPLTPLIGRDAELAHVMEMLSGEARLLTITGIGGIGKTRLATQVALEMEPHFSHGVVLVPLADQYVEAAIPAEIAKAFGQASPGIDVSALASIIGTGTQLLVLDNLEQIPNAGGTISDIVSALPHLSVLCTSQMPLDVPGEHVYPLQPMPVADGGASAIDLRSNASIAMFMYRVHAANPHLKFDDDDLRIVADICAMLDGIPLAIELAAARTSILPLNELQVRLEHRLDVLAGGSKHAPGRLRTMRNAIRWSYGLLNPDEQRIFKHLGVYSGNLHIDAVAHTLTTLNLTESPLDTIETFVSRSLLRRVSNGGYQMLQTLREFALEQLDADGDAHGARLAQATYVVDMVESISLLLNGKDGKKWYGVLDNERQNILSAAEWTVEHGPEITLRIIAAIWKELDFLGISHRYIELGLKAAGRNVSANVRIRGLLGVGIMQMSLHDHPDNARSTLNTVLELSREYGDRYAETRALNSLGLLELHRGELDASMSLFLTAEGVAKQEQDVSSLNAVRANMASVASTKDDLDFALEQYLLVLQAYETANNLAMSAVTNCNVGITYERRGEFHSAQMYLDRAIDLAKSLDNVPVALFSLMALGNVHVAQKNYDTAHSYYEEGIALAQRTNRRAHEMELRIADLLIHVKTGNLHDAMSEMASTLAISSSDYASDAIIGGAAVVAIAAYQSGNLQGAASLTGAVVSSPVFNSSFPDYLSATLETIRSSIPDNPKELLRIAFDAGAGWDLETISTRASQLAREYNAQHGEGNTLPEPVPTLPAYSISPRETEVLTMVAKGLSNAEIANEMFVSLRTTTTHLTNIFNKLDVKNRSSAVAVAREFGLLPSS